MICNGQPLLNVAPIIDMSKTKLKGPGGVTYGLGEAGYDIRIKQTIIFSKLGLQGAMSVCNLSDVARVGRFVLASAIEEFDMPDWLVGVVHDKSTWARRGLSVFNTVIEPGWKGFLTLELVYHGDEDLIIPAGSGIAQVMFHQVLVPTAYEGRYQNQEDKPVEAKSV